MQRRLTLALLATALAAIVLVGAGVLTLARIGAEREARDRVAVQLDAVVELVERSGRANDIGPVVARLGDAFDGVTIDLGILGPNGGLRSLRRDRNNNDIGPALDAASVSTAGSGEAVYTRVGDRVRGIRTVDVELPSQFSGASGIVIVQSQVATIGARARLWFVLSGAIVLLGAALVASLLARRFVRPIRQATAAAASIAGGDLGVRVPVVGTDEIADLGAGINNMAAELERGRAAEQQFLLSVSHDLRTPLTAIRGFGEALEDGTAVDAQKAGAVITHHANRLGRLVSDLLDLGKLEARQFRFAMRPIDAATVIRAAATGAEPQARERGVVISAAADDTAMVHADPDRLGQIVANLIENALAFAESSVDITVAASDGFVAVTVADDGPGIDSADLPHVFERLYVTKLVPERSESSSGLGLAIVRELTLAMGGTVHAAPRGGGGTSMVVRFPALPTAPPPPA